MQKIFIGIDPGVKTGLALSVNKQLIQVVTMDIYAGQAWVLETINNYSDVIVLVRIENPNLRKWYGANANAKLQGAGSIKRDYSIWKKFLEYHAISYEDVDPKTIKTKLDHKTFCNLTKWKARTSEHSRDAAMMVFKK